MEEEKKRKVELDIYKGIAIILVVLSHLTFENQLLRTIIHSFNMPAFFIISGYLYKKTNIKKIIKNYLLPAYIVLIFDLIKYIIKSKFVLNLKELICGFTLIGGFFTNAPLWFLPVLACLCILMNLLNNKKICNYIFVAVCITINLLNLKIFPQMYFWPMAIFSSYPFYFIGYFIKEKNIKINLKWHLKFLCILLFVVIAVYNGYVSIIQQIYGNSYLLFLITGLIGSYIIYIISTFLKYKNCKVLETLGKNSIYILLTHFYLCRSVIPKILKILNIQSI